MPPKKDRPFPAEPYYCKTCGKGCKSVQGLAQHIRRKHKRSSGVNEDGEHLCHKCGWSTNIASHLEPHWRLTCPGILETEGGGGKEERAPGRGLRLSTIAEMPDEEMPMDDEGGYMEVEGNYHEDADDRFLREFIECHRHAGQTRFGLHDTGDEDENWVLDEPLYDCLRIMDFSMRNDLSNRGTEEMIGLFKDMGCGKSERIQSLPATWETLSKRVLKADPRVLDETRYKTYHYPVPEELGLGFDRVPFTLKRFESLLDELLTDVELMAPGNFYFGKDKG